MQASDQAPGGAARAAPPAIPAAKPPYCRVNSLRSFGPCSGLFS